VPTRIDWQDFYDIVIEETLTEGENKIAVLKFSAKHTYDYIVPIMEGRLYIDFNNFDLLKIEGEIISNNLNLVSLNSKDGEWYNYRLTYEAAYTQNDSLGLLLDYVRTGQSFDYWKEGRFDKRVQTEAQLTMYEYYQPKKFKRLGGRLQFNKSDIDRIDRVVYNKKFWRDNPIVKRTPIEEEVIASFEAERQFGSIFLNNQNQVSLMPELETDPAMQQLISMMGLHLRTQEKVYLHFDKPYYALGENIWFKAYLFDAQNHALGYTPSKVLYVDLIAPNGTLITHHQLLIENGTANGDFILNDNLTTGNYQVRAYTNWMKNFEETWFYSKVISVYGKEALLEGSTAIAEKDSTLADLQFFPEGGDLVNTVPAQVGFKAVNKQGLGVAANGKIVDENNKLLTFFSTLHAGMGSVFFTPKPGKSYKAVVKVNGEEKEFPLPKALESGYGMMVNNSKPNSVSVRVVATENLEETEVYLIGQTRSRVYYKGKGTIQKRILYFEIPRQLLPSGILHLTLLTNQMEPLNERLVFINFAQDLHIDVKTNKKRYKGREKVKVSINVTDAEGKPQVAQLSMSVTDAGQILIGQQRESILSNLLLTSDLKGNIENPAFYFKDEEPNTPKALDALMLTQGWRRFAWQDIIDLNETRVVFPYEQGFSLKGNAIEPETGEPFSFKKMYLTAMGSSSGLWTTETNAEGDFNFRNLTFSDSSEVLIQGNWAAKQVAALEVKLDTIIYPEINYKGEELKVLQSKKNEVFNYLVKTEERKEIDLAYPDQKTLVLDEVKVKDKRIFSEDKAPKIYSDPDAVIKFDEQMASAATHVLSPLVGRVAGVTVTGTGVGMQVRIRGAAQPPLILVDGMPFYTPPFSSSSGGQSLVSGLLSSSSGINTGTPGGGSFYGNYTSSSEEGTGLEGLAGIQPSEVDRIEVLKGPSTAVFGLMGGNGVIAIYTKQGGKARLPAPNLFKHVGYYKAREFYTPKYDIPEAAHAKPDKRATLFWQPSFLTNKNGKASFEFFNSDEAENFQIVVEGTDGYGTLGSQWHNVNIGIPKKQ